MRRLILALALTLIPAMAFAYERVSDQQTFVALISGKTLSNRLYGVRLNVSPNGSIAGGAWGWAISGNWTWDNGFFCRDITWGDDSVGYNCQLVEVRGGDELRFTSDQGTGDNASFKLR
ncbi:MAG: dihydrodipicolinate reductase [Yoonia sp.]|nr:dihydrodipicolinate reductase [Yoonia sp.]